jgi:hypothetical protein
MERNIRKYIYLQHIYKYICILGIPYTIHIHPWNIPHGSPMGVLAEEEARQSSLQRLRRFLFRRQPHANPRAEFQRLAVLQCFGTDKPEPEGWEEQVR